MLGKRLFATTTGALLSKGAAIITALLLFRQLPAADMGRYTAALTLVSFCAILANAGLNPLTTREIARLGKEARAWWMTIAPLRLLLALASYAVLVLVALFIPGLVDARLALIAGLLLVPDALAALLAATLNGLSHAALASWLDALSSLIRLLATLALLLLWHAGLFALAWLAVALSGAAFALNGLALLKTWRLPLAHSISTKGNGGDTRQTPRPLSLTVFSGAAGARSARPPTRSRQGALRERPTGARVRKPCFRKQRWPKARRRYKRPSSPRPSWEQRREALIPPASVPARGKERVLVPPALGGDGYGKSHHAPLSSKHCRGERNPRPVPAGTTALQGPYPLPAQRPALQGPYPLLTGRGLLSPRQCFRGQQEQEAPAPPPRAARDGGGTSTPHPLAPGGNDGAKGVDRRTLAGQGRNGGCLYRRPPCRPWVGMGVARATRLRSRRKSVRDRGRGLWRQALMAALPLGIGALAATLYFRVDTLFLSAARGEQAVAYYSAPYQIVESFWLISTSWNAIALPALARSYSPRFVERSVALLLSLGLPASLLIAFRAEDVTRLVFGQDYLPAALPLRWVIWVVPILFGYVPVVTALFVHDRQGRVLLVLLSNLALALLLDALLIPPYGATGASIATVIVEAGALAGYLWLAHQAKLGINWARGLAQPVLISMPLIGLLVIGRGLPFPLLLALTLLLWAALFGLAGKTAPGVLAGHEARLRGLLRWPTSVLARAGGLCGSESLQARSLAASPSSEEVNAP